MKNVFSKLLISRTWKILRKYLSDIDNIIKFVTLLAVLFYTQLTYFLWRDSNMHSLMQERPWIDSKPVLNELSVLNNGGILFNIQFKLSNIGHSPSYKTWVAWTPVAYTSGGSDKVINIKARQREQCAFSRNQIYDAQQFILPGKDTLFNFGNSFPIIAKSDIDNDIEKNATKIKKLLPTPYSETSRVIPYTVFYIVGCVNYRFSDYGETHQTSFAFKVGHLVKSDHMETFQPFQWSQTGKNDLNNVELLETSIGSFGN